MKGREADGHLTFTFHEKMTFNENKIQQEPWYHSLNDNITFKRLKMN